MVFTTKECDMSFTVHGCCEVPALPVMDCKQQKKNTRLLLVAVMPQPAVLRPIYVKIWGHFMSELLQILTEKAHISVRSPVKLTTNLTQNTDETSSLSWVTDDKRKPLPKTMSQQPQDFKELAFVNFCFMTQCLSGKTYRCMFSFV